MIRAAMREGLGLGSSDCVCLNRISENLGLELAGLAFAQIWQVVVLEPSDAAFEELVQNAAQNADRQFTRVFCHHDVFSGVWVHVLNLQRCSLYHLVTKSLPNTAAANTKGPYPKGPCT